MGDRTVLGPADISDEELAAVVGDWLGESRGGVELLDASADVVPYDLDAITTAGRYWVSGTAGTPRGRVPFRFFVKHIQSWSRSPQFADVPPEFREMAEAGVPWRTEALVYRSDLAERLPDGLRMPRAAAVFDLDDKSAVVWLEAVPVVERTWGVDELAHAAYLLGRLAGSPRVAELGGVGQADCHWTVRDYLDGRLKVQILPMLRSEQIWRHPLLAGAFDSELRGRLLSAADRAEAYVDEIEDVVEGSSHGDACTNNLLVQADSDDLVLIDYGFWGTKPIGFDLAQLLLGDVQLGRRPAGSLGEIESALIPAYVSGLCDEGARVSADTVRRAHALQMFLFSGLSAFPIEHLDKEPTPELHRIAAERAAAARFMLDLVDSTSSGRRT
jgi:Phosphotransferase enzyme family